MHFRKLRTWLPRDRVSETVGWRSGAVSAAIIRRLTPCHCFTMATEETPPARLTSCGCGKHIHQSLIRCTSCSRELQRQHSQQARHFTPPPSGATSPRSGSPKSLQPPSRPNGPRPSHAVIALNNAFSSEDEIPWFFPKKMYCIAEKSSAQSRTNSAPSQRSCPSNEEATQSYARQSLDTPMPPPCEQQSSNEAAYAPMAAAFVRAARDVHITSSSPDKLSRGRSGSVRPEMELEARLFDGPA